MRPRKIGLGSALELGSLLCADFVWKRGMPLDECVAFEKLHGGCMYGILGLQQAPPGRPFSETQRRT
jgi:hypothetical protein